MLTAREKFRIGDLVRFNDKATKADVQPKDEGSWECDVVGFGTRNRCSVRVLRHGTKQPVTFHMDYLTIIKQVGERKGNQWTKKEQVTRSSFVGGSNG